MKILSTMSKKLVLISLISLVSVFIGGEVAAQEISPRFGVAPHTFELDVLPGEERFEKIKIFNQSEVAIPISTQMTDFTAAQETGQMIFDESVQDPSFASRFWFKIENPSFILDPGEMEEVKFKISVPEDAEPGGKYATMLFEPQLPSYYFKEGQPRAIPVIGVLFLFSVKKFVLEPDTGEKLSVVEFSLPKEERIIALESLFSKLLGSVAQAVQFPITKTSPSNFILRIKNNDIYHIRPAGKVLIYNWFGKKVGETEVSQLTILPGKIRKFPVEFSPEIPKQLRWLPASISNFLVQNFFVGRYKAEVELEAKSPLSAELFKPNTPTILTFFSLPWKFWLPFVLLLVLLMVFIVKYRKRIVLAVKTLIG